MSEKQRALMPDRQLLDDIVAMKRKVAYYESAFYYIINEADALGIASDIAQAALDGTYLNEPDFEHE